MFSLTFWYSDCIESRAVGAIIEMAGFDIILGPPCTACKFVSHMEKFFSAAVMGGSVGKTFNTPLIMWGPQYAATLLNKDDYPTLMASSSAGIK